jgi:MoaA/NifB/PqqE/SkfB family radical SAM enzyme/alpha-beta hydrolase superfamily lysophospholipase
MNTTSAGGVAVGHVLVHGYLGSPANLAPLAAALVDAGDVESLHLPRHEGVGTPAFDEQDCQSTLSAAIHHQREAGRRLVLIGHSTGGNLILSWLARELESRPNSLDDLLLVVLCAAPPRINTAYAHRWATHREAHGRQPALHDLASLAAMVNRLARRTAQPLPAPVLIVQGNDDELVPAADAENWRDRIATSTRLVRVADVGHHLFEGAGSAIAIDAIRRAVDDARLASALPAPLQGLPGLAAFGTASPHALRHLAESPAGRRLLGQCFAADPVAAIEPTVANIEITTRCTLACVSCARTRLKPRSRFMSRSDFVGVLDALPHAWRVVLVGLGEPLLHPEVIDFVRLAADRGRRVGLVTNAMQLGAGMARALCSSGLASITFSLDAIDPAAARRVRRGSRMPHILANIRGFMAERERQGARLGTSVFTALTAETVGELEAIVDFAAGVGIDALMASDLNFPVNQPRSVRAAFDDHAGRILRHALRQAAARRLPVLSVRGLEELDLQRRWPEFLMLRGEQLAERSTRHSHCLSPWQSIPVGVDGRLTICDCQPDAEVGNLHTTPLSEWWNGPTMTAHRRRMLSNDPPEACRDCPRL